MRQQSPYDPVAPAPGAIPVSRAGYGERAAQLVWLLTAVVDVLLAMRFVLEFLGASSASSFVTLVYGLTAPLVTPFLGIFTTSHAQRLVFEPAALIGILVYSMAGAAVATLLRIAGSGRGAAVR